MPVRHLIAGLLLAVVPLIAHAEPTHVLDVDVGRAVPVDAIGTPTGPVVNSTVPVDRIGTPTPATAELPMSFTAARRSLVERIRRVQPDWDQEHRFIADDVDGGPTVPLEQIVDQVTRRFELRSNPPVDDGSAGWAYDRWRASMTLLVRYSTANRARTNLQIASDVPRLTHALIHPSWPAAWDPSIESVTPPGAPVVTELRNDDGPIGVLLALRFDLIYRDAGELG